MSPTRAQADITHSHHPAAAGRCDGRGDASGQGTCLGAVCLGTRASATHTVRRRGIATAPTAAVTSAAAAAVPATQPVATARAAALAGSADSVAPTTGATPSGT
eukprot:scaffold8751_cov98-Isochrysis_galbana.AAC.3